MECGGLGDRLYGIVMAFYVAVLSNRTFLFEDWNEPTPISTFVEPALIAWDAAATWDSGGGNMLKITDNRKHPLLLEPCELGSTRFGGVVNLQTNLMTHDNVLHNSTCFRDFCARNGGCSDTRPLFHIGFWTLFRFTKQLQNEANEMRKIAGIGNNKKSFYISMHVRTGQGETWDDPLRHSGESALKSFHECAVRLQTALKQHCNLLRQPLVYVASDNNYAKVRIQSWDSSNTFKALSDIEVFHVGKTRSSEINDLDLAYHRVWAELSILIDSKCIIMSRSKFSFMASDLSPQRPRCALMYDDCGHEKVMDATNFLKC